MISMGIELGKITAKHVYQADKQWGIMPGYLSYQISWYPNLYPLSSIQNWHTHYDCPK